MPGAVYNFFVSRRVLEARIYAKTLRFLPSVSSVKIRGRAKLDINDRVTIMAVFYAPSFYDARSFSESRYHSKILRTTHHARAKRTPDTPQFQEKT